MEEEVAEEVVAAGKREVLKNNKTGARRDDGLLWCRAEPSG